MQEMTEKFNEEAVSKNLSVFMGETAKEYVPHHVTENAYLERLDPKELEEIKQDLVYHLIRKRCFGDARYKKKWLVIVDGTQLYCGRRKLNEHCLERCSNKGTDKEIRLYHRAVPEAKIYFGEKLVASIGSGEILMSAKVPKKAGKGYQNPAVGHIVGLKRKIRGERKRLLRMAGY